jgi:uncharacterized repeat protein (TIGR01451 family)
MRGKRFARIAMYNELRSSHILSSGRGLLFAAGIAVLGLLTHTAEAQTPISLFSNIVGHVNYQATGNSLRSAPNTSSACSLTGASSAGIAGIPAGASIRAAYLYWAGSGSAIDTTVVLNGSAITADRSFTDTFVFGGTDFDFFSGYADVTTQIGGNGVYTFTGLTVDNGGQYCASQAVVAGWSLVVVYEHPDEDLRAVNIFDGFELFRADSLTLTVDTYRIPAIPINGKLTAITWEGDPQNSGGLGGFSESLLFNGNLLDDGLIPPASSPGIQQFDGTVNTTGSTTSHGVDVDTYDVSPFLSAGDTSATMTFSSGADLVLLSAEIISFTTEPVVDLEISKTHAGDFSVGSSGDYVIAITNNGPEDEANAINVSDTLPAGLTLVSSAGTGWSCSVSGADVDCIHPGPLAAGSALPDLILTVDVAASAAPGVTNTAIVTSASVDIDPANNTASDSTTVIASDLSTSTKSVVDLNGGDANPGDILRYTISLNETAGVAASGVALTDDIPVFVDSWSFVSVPTGVTDNSTGAGTGANGNGLIDLADLVVPAGSTLDIVFDAVISATANPGDIIANQATIANPDGIGGAPAAADVVVSISAIPSGGTKTLYLFGTGSADPNGFNEGPAPYLSRTPPTTGQTRIRTSNFDSPVSWTMTPALQAPLTIDAGTIPVTLFAGRNGRGGVRRLEVALSTTGAVTGPLGAPVVQQFTAPAGGSATEMTFAIPLAAVTTLPAGTQIVMTVTNVSPGGGRPRIVFIYPTFGGENSRIDMTALTVIRVDATTNFNAAFPAGTPQAGFTPGATVSLRADVSDPFGSFDISSVTVDVTDDTGTPVATGEAMALVDPIDGSAAQYEYLLTLPSTASGTWNWRVTAVEGTEGTVTHQRTGSFFIAVPQLTFTKSVNVLSDPYNGATNPKAIPGAVMLYSVTLSNSGAVQVDADSLAITDILAPETSLYVDSSGGDPIAFVDGTPGSGLSFDFTTAVTFSNQPDGGSPYDYVPTPDIDGFDPAVTGFQVTPGGALAAGTSGGAPGFTLRYRTRVE